MTLTGIIKIVVVGLPVIVGALNGLNYEGYEIMEPPEDEAVSAVLSGVSVLANMMLLMRLK